MTQLLRRYLLSLIGGFAIILGLFPSPGMGSDAQPASAAGTRAVRVDSSGPAPSGSLQPAVWTSSDEATQIQPVAYRRHVRHPRRTRYYYARHRVRPVHYKRRSWKKSAAIVGGSAAAGTAIGAIAGGKKGAAIGAVSGGTAGFVYDRATHKKRQR